MRTNRQTEAPEGAPKLSELLIEGDFKPEDAKYWQVSEMSSAVAHQAEAAAKREFQRLVVTVVKDADTHDVLILNQALRDWIDFNGEDRIQSGTLVASILIAAGVTPEGNNGTQERIRQAALHEAARRLTAGGVQFTDDSKEPVRCQ